MRDARETRAKALKVVSYGLCYAALFAIAASMIFPYLWMLMTSFKTRMEANSIVPTLFPKVWVTENYARIWQEVPFFSGLLNTLAIIVCIVPLGTFVSGLAAFSFAKLKLPFRKTLLLVVMCPMMIPYAAVLLPQYRAYFALHLTNTLWPLILPGLFGNISMMFFFCQFMMRIPSSTFEAAKVDGSGYLRMYASIMLPMLKPALATQIVFWFMGAWNDFFAPSIYLTKDSVMTLQVLLSSLNSQYSAGGNLPLIMTGAVLSSIPILIIYIAFQRYFVESLAISGIKG